VLSAGNYRTLTAAVMRKRCAVVQIFREKQLDLCKKFTLVSHLSGIIPDRDKRREAYHV